MNAAFVAMATKARRFATSTRICAVIWIVVLRAILA
jgi:hypothetical protein